MIQRRIRKEIVILCVIMVIVAFMSSSKLTYDKPPESIHSFKVTDYKYYRDGVSYVIESDGNRYDLYSETSLSIGDICRGSFSVTFPGEERNFIKKNEQLRLLMNGFNGRIYDDEITDCTEGQFTLLMRLNTMRYEYIDRILKGTEHEFKYDVITLSIGNKSYIDSDFFDALQKLGIYHLYVISGTHVAFVSGCLFFIFRKMRMTIEMIKWLLIISLTLFLLFNFFSPSVFRAVFMAVTLLVTSMFRKKPYLTVISLSAILQILYNPLILYHAGFQLSYITTYFILLSRVYFENAAPIKQLFGITVIAEISTLIIIIIQFNEISISGIIMNFIFVPLFSVVIFPGVIIYNITVLLNIHFLIDDVLQFIFYWIKELILFLGHAFKHRFPIRNMREEGIILCIIITYLMAKSLLLNRHKQVILLAIGFTLIMYVNNKVQVDDFTMTMVDVGQGDAFIVEDHSNDMVVMIDTGGRFYQDTAVIQQSEKNILPYLKEQGIDKIDLLILTHMDIDHVGESAHILSKMKVDQLMVNIQDPKLNGWLQEISGFSGDLIDANKINELKIGDIYLENLYHDYNDYLESSNDFSLVMRLSMHKFSFLMTGDMTAEMEEKLLNNEVDVSADILKLAHHGSDSSSISEFLEAVRYHTVLVSAGVNNRYNHPNDAVMERVGSTRVYNTQEDGMTRFKIRKNMMCSETKLSAQKAVCIKKDE